MKELWLILGTIVAILTITLGAALVGGPCKCGERAATEVVGRE